jgi:hypothetical protein
MKGETMKFKVMIGEQLTDLELHVGTITQFAPGTGNLACRDIVVMAENTQIAAALVAQKYPEWELQSLTCLTAVPWFKAIFLDDNCPQVYGIRDFMLQHLVSVPADED